MFWVAFGVGIFIGLFVGLAMCKFIKVGAFVLAGWAGFCFGLLLNEKIMFWADYIWLFWIINLFSVIAGVVMLLKFYDEGLIVSSVIVGSYMIMRGITCFIGGYYNEFVIARAVREGILNEADPYYWMYLGVFIAAAVGGTLFQCYAWTKEKERK